WPLAAFLETTFARVALVRIALSLGVGFLAQRLSRRAAGPLAWHALGLGGLAHLTLYAGFRAREQRRPRSVGADAVRPEQGISELTAGAGTASPGLFETVPGSATSGYAGAGAARLAAIDDGVVVRRFSSLAFASVMA